MVASLQTLKIRRPSQIRPLKTEDLDALRLVDSVRRKDSSNPRLTDTFGDDSDDPALDRAVYLVEKWAIFCPGPWNGGPNEDGTSEWTAKDCEDMVRNFHQFTQPINSETPYHVPRVTLKHDNGFVLGWVVDCGWDGAWMWVTLAVNHPTAIALDTLLFDQASVEFWDTYREEIETKAGFPRRPNGQAWGIIMRAVTLCGGEPPSVRGQPKPPRPVRAFSDQAAYGSVPVEILKMDPKIQAALQQVVTILQGVMGGGPAPTDAPPPPAEGAPAMPSDQPINMMDELPPDGMDVDPNAMAGMPAAGVKAFTDLATRQKALVNVVRKQNGIISRFDTMLADQKKKADSDAKAAHLTNVRTFLDSTAVKARIGGNQHRETWENMLSDPAKFEDGKKLVMSLPDRGFGNRIFPTAPPANQTNADGTGELNATNEDLPFQMTADDLLSKTSQGRHAMRLREARLAKQTAGAN